MGNNNIDTNLTWFDFYKSAVEQTIDPSLEPEKKVVIYSLISDAINAYDKGDLSDSLEKLFLFRNYIFPPDDSPSPVRPESLSPNLVDFLGHEEMWDWVAGVQDSENLSAYDVEAIKYVMADLKEMFDENKIFADEEEIEDEITQYI